MVTASVIRVRGGCGNMRVRINGQAMNQFVQLTLLEISSSLTESVKMCRDMDPTQGLHIPNVDE